jgi:hypothetical protein
MVLSTSGDRAMLQRWERARSLGRTAFVWRYGVFAWGIPAAALTIAYKVFQEHGALSPEVLGAPFSQKLRIAIAISLVFFPALGHMLGQKLWQQGEAKYDQMRQDKSDRSS